MCGFVGILGEFEKDEIIKMTDSISHRGPNDVGYFYDQNLALGFRRLSIIDLSMNAHQPMITPDNRYAIVFNGEIYNYKKLREELRLKGYSFNSNSDTEVVLNGYIEWGSLVLEKLNGMFAFGIWDNIKSELFLARDRVGIKPLYYNYNPEQNRFIFASEIRAFLSTGFLSPKISKSALSDYLNYGSIKQPLSIIEGIKSLLPGQYILLKNNRIEFNTYWKYSDNIQLSKKSNKVYELDNIFKEVIADQMISDVPYGLFLSGGIDSTLLLSYMSEISHDRVETVSIGFSDEVDEFNEINLSRKTAAIFKSNHHEVIIKSNEVNQELDKFINSLDQPSYDGLNSYFVSKFAKKYVTVALSGLGGDELFMGYNHQINSLTKRHLLKIAYPFKKIIKKITPLLISKHLHEKNLTNQLRGIFENNDNLYDSYYQKDFRIFNKFELDHLLKDKTIISPLKGDNYSDLFDIILYSDLNNYMRHTLLRDTDAVSMFNSLEVRVPFLDNRLIDYALTLPMEYKYNKSKGGKAILKELLLRRNKSLGYLLNPKKGFVFPLDYWLRRYFKAEVYKSILAEPSEILEIFDYLKLKKLLDDFYNGRNIYYMKIWTIFVLSKWAKSFGMTL